MSDIDSPTIASRRGRPSNAEIAARAQATAPETARRTTETQARRRRRDDMGPGARRKLHVPEGLKDREYVYRWVNDDGRRVHDLSTLDDWDTVHSPDIAAGAEGGNGTAGLGTRIEAVVGKTDSGQPLRAVLMRKRREFHEEDERHKAAVADERVLGIRQGGSQDPNGLLPGTHSYVPSSGIRIEENRK